MHSTDTPTPSLQVAPHPSSLLPALLSVRHLSAWWAQARALSDISFEVYPGEMLVLQGLNGAGKSSLLQCIAGIGPRAIGEIDYKATRDETKPLAFLHHDKAMPSHLRARAGLGFVAEDRRLFTQLSVRENLRLGLYAARVESAGFSEHDLEEQVLALFPPLKPMLGRSAAQMSGGEQQMLAIARSLMGRPKLLVLDEPCEGIAPVLAERLSEALMHLRAQGLSLLVAEQNQILAQHANRVAVLESGVLLPLSIKSPN